jgi:hypothetical protein
MKSLIPVALIALLLVIGGVRLWAGRYLRVPSVEQKALVLDASSQSNVWLPMCLAVFAGWVVWLPAPSVTPYYVPGVFASYALVPFLLSVAASMNTVIRLSRLSLPPSYLRNVRLRAIVFHAALLFLIGVVSYDLFVYSRQRNQSRQTLNQSTMADSEQPRA